MLQDELALKYKYKKLPIDISETAKETYLNSLPDFLNINGNVNFVIKSKNGTIIAYGYKRIVIGDYGAFIEIDESQINNTNISIQKGQEYRIFDEKYNKHVKYFWLTANDNSGIKIYFQQKTVSYADYKPNMYYISPFEINDK